ncbi:MAG: hypothetical protein KDD62_07525, partial [Bdellovibrionales bacterium]|nr:hypothetical protein [Bdellovibrionales bacterium]
VLVPIISSFKEMGVTKEDRARILENDVKQFNYAIAEGRSMAALKYVQDEYQSEFKDQLRGVSRDEKIVDASVSFVDLSEDGYHADVEMLVRFFNKSRMIVNERLEKQRWYFSMSDGWRLGDREILEETPA